MGFPIYDTTEWHVLLNALDALAEQLPDDDPDQPTIRELTERVGRNRP